MNDKTTIRVRIGNMTYQLSARENSQYILEIAKEADEILQQIRQVNPSLNTVNVAVLGLVNALDQKAKIEERATGVSGQGSDKNYHTMYDEAHRERMELREACWDLKKELIYYKNLCEVYEEKIDELNQLTALDKQPLKKVVRQDFNALDELQTSLADLAETADKNEKKAKDSNEIQEVQSESTEKKLGIACK